MRKLYFLALLFFGSPQPLQATGYEIKLDRPLRVGDTFLLEAQGWQSEKSTIHVDGELLRDDRENFLLEFEGVVTVLAVDSKGRVTSESAKVIRCEKTEAYDRKPLLKEGVVVEAGLREGKLNFTVDGVPAGREVTTALDLIFPMKKKGATDDELFGTKERKQVGERWGVNRKAVANEFGNDSIAVSTERISGGSTLEKVTRVNGVECLQIGSELQVEGLIPELPEGMAVERSSMETTSLSTLPTDGARMPLEEATGVNFTFVASGNQEQDSPELVLESMLNLRVNQKTALLRAGPAGR